MPNERCKFWHADALGKKTLHEGEVVERVNADVLRVKPDRYGFNVLIPTKDLVDEQRSPDAQSTLPDAAGESQGHD